MVDCIISAIVPAERSLTGDFGIQDAAAAFFREVQIEEALPCINPGPGMSPTEYLDLIERRSANPAIQDTMRHVAFDESSGHAGFVLPVPRHALSAGG